MSRKGQLAAQPNAGLSLSSADHDRGNNSTSSNRRPAPTTVAWNVTASMEFGGVFKSEAEELARTDTKGLFYAFRRMTKGFSLLF